MLTFPVNYSSALKNAQGLPNALLVDIVLEPYKKSFNQQRKYDALSKQTLISQTHLRGSIADECQFRFSSLVDHFLSVLRTSCKIVLL